VCPDHERIAHHPDPEHALIGTGTGIVVARELFWGIMGFADTTVAGT